MKKNKTLLFALSLSAVLVLAGCGDTTSTSSDSIDGGGTMTDTSSTPIGTTGTPDGTDTTSTEPVEATIEIVGAPETAVPGATIKLNADVSGTEAGVVWKLASKTGTAQYPSDATIEQDGTLFVGTYEDVLTITATAGEATDTVTITIKAPAIVADDLGIANGYRLSNSNMFTDAGGAPVTVVFDVTPNGIYTGLYDSGYVADGEAAYMFYPDEEGGYYYNTALDLVEDATMADLWAEADLSSSIDEYAFSYYEPEDLDAGVIGNNVYVKMADPEYSDPESFIFYSLGLYDVLGLELVATQLHVEAASGAAIGLDFLYAYGGSYYYVPFEVYEKTDIDQEPYAVAIEDGGSTEEGVTEPWGE